MHRTITTALIVLALTLVAGCASTSVETGYDTQAGDMDPFLDGSDRKPTAKTLYRMARLLIVQDKDEQAAFVLTRLMSEYPTFIPAYIELAEVHMRQRRVDEAMDVLASGLVVAPGHAPLMNNLGMCAMIKSDYHAALDHFTRASATEPDDARYRANMAAALGMLGRYDESLAIYEMIVTRGKAHYNVAVLAEARNDTERARQAHFDARRYGYDPDKL